jgi:hypothetical protein
MPEKSSYDERRHEATMLRLGGASAESAAHWLSAISKAEQAGQPCPSWAELEIIAPSRPVSVQEQSEADVNKLLLSLVNAVLALYGVNPPHPTTGIREIAQALEHLATAKRITDRHE